MNRPKKKSNENCSWSKSIRIRINLDQSDQKAYLSIFLDHPIKKMYLTENFHFWSCDFANADSAIFAVKVPILEMVSTRAKQTKKICHYSTYMVAITWTKISVYGHFFDETFLFNLGITWIYRYGYQLYKQYWFSIMQTIPSLMDYPKITWFRTFPFL